MMKAHNGFSQSQISNLKNKGFPMTNSDIIIAQKSSRAAEDCSSPCDKPGSRAPENVRAKTAGLIFHPPLAGAPVCDGWGRPQKIIFHGINQNPCG
jgi:hypothetical protein